MLRLFDSLAFKTRLAGSYTVLVALLLLVSVVSISSLRTTNRSVLDIGQNWLPSVHVVDSMHGATWEYRATLLRHIISSNPQDMQRIEDELEDVEKKIEQQLQDYARLISSDEERRLHKEIGEGWARYHKTTSEQIIPLSRSLRTEEAMHRVQTQSSLFATLSSNLEKLVAINQRGTQASVASAATAYSRSVMLSIVLLAMAVATAIGMALLMLRSSTRQLGGDPALAQDVVIRMSRGEFDTEIPLQANDQHSVLAGMRQLQLALQDLAQAQNGMLVQHASGASSHRIDTSTLNGGYQKLANISNQLMDQRIALMDEVVALMQQYSRGDFRNQLRVLPGELRELTEVFGRVRQQLIKLKDASLELAAAASRGDFSRRGQASEFEFDFREIIEALNNLMANADGGLAEVGKVIGRMADGDLNSRVVGHFEGRFAELRDDTNQMAQQLVQIVTTIIDGSVQVDQAAREIASANQDLSARTEQQAASLEETASSMEEFTSTVRQNAENARAANQLALNAGGVAERGGAVVGEVVTTMSDIAATSRKISDITSVIDGIAFQTNILALNAAVEAARAGEQGRGFAVVASEVRSLAQRAGTAAREIKGLVDESSSRVDTGVKMVQQAGDTMRDIVDSVKRLGDLVVEITSASQEQTQGIEQVSTTISQMDQVTQQNAAMVEQAAAAARSLQSQAETLTQAVGFFKIDRVGEPGAARRAAPKSPQGAAVASTKPRAGGAVRPVRAAASAAAAATSDQWESF